MKLKLIGFFLKIWYFLTPKDKSEYVNYHILSKDEFYAKQDELILDQVIYEDEIKTVRTNKRGSPIDADFVLKKPLFVCKKRENDYIRELRKKAYIGINNFPEFEKFKTEHDKILLEREGLMRDFDLQRRELTAKIKLLDFLKRELSVNTYEQYENKFNQIQGSVRQ